MGETPWVTPWVAQGSGVGHAHGELQALDGEIRLDDAGSAHARPQDVVRGREVVGC